MRTDAAILMGEANRGKPLMVFDWVKAAQLIKQYKAFEAYAGLRDDWEYTGGCIFMDGKPVNKEDTYVYLASTWATPEIDIYGDVFPCYIMQSASPEGKWDADTYWPQEALNELNKGE